MPAFEALRCLELLSRGTDAQLKISLTETRGRNTKEIVTMTAFCLQDTRIEEELQDNKAEVSETTAYCFALVQLCVVMVVR